MYKYSKKIIKIHLNLVDKIKKCLYYKNRFAKGVIICGKWKIKDTM